MAAEAEDISRLRTRSAVGRLKRKKPAQPTASPSGLAVADDHIWPARPRGRDVDAAVDANAKTRGFAGSVLETLNQLHNQFANESFVDLPEWRCCFCRCISSAGPDVLERSEDRTSAGGRGHLRRFFAVGLTESVLVLSLPACIYTVLSCFVIAPRGSVARSAG